MTQPTYSAARTAADHVHRQLARYPIPSRATTATAPDAATLAALIDAAFWTSLRREELYTPRISLAFIDPKQVSEPISFATPVPLVPGNLTRLAAAVERPGIHLCVWSILEELQVWGIARQLPPLCLVVEIIVPGLLVVKRSPLTESGKFLNIAVLQGDEIKIIDPTVANGPDGSAILASQTRPATQFASGAAGNVLLELAVSIRAHGRGGMLLVVPADSNAWTESILHPVTYKVMPAFSGLGELIRNEAGVQPNPGSLEAMARMVGGIAGLTAVDGATVITANYDLLAFGAKIVRRTRAPLVSRVIVTEPLEGGRAVMAEPGEMGGTRHLAAAQFVQDQRDSIALVASQDGRFTVFGWSSSEEMVQGHRIDVLLL